MAAEELTLSAGWSSFDHRSSLLLSSLALLVLYLSGSIIYDIYHGPLSKFPGPKLSAASIWPYIRTIVNGNDNTDIPALHAKYGPVVRISPRHLSYANGAEAFREIYGSGSLKRGLRKDVQFYGKPVNGVHSLVTADDAEHRRQRKVLSYGFSDRAVKDQEALLKRWAALLEAKMRESAADGAKTDVAKFYNCATFDIMSDLTFAEGLNMLEDAELSPWVKTAFAGIKVATKFRGLKMFNKLTDYLTEEYIFQSGFVRRKQLEHHNYCTERVDRRLAGVPKHHDLWSEILAKSEGLSLEEHHSTATFLMLAGTETTASALSGTTFLLLTNPDKLRTLTRELRAAFPGGRNDMILENLAREKYLTAVLQEGMRMYPPVPSELPRVVPAGGTTLFGEHIPGGTTIGVHHMTTYRREEFFRKPDEFHPERWLGDPEFKDDKLDAVENFSVGPRNCIGKGLAWHEMRLLLATVVLAFDMKICEESRDWDVQKVFIVWEKKPLMVQLTPARGSV